jgi:predicted enzyme related to lactoylglutathione lyase
MLITILFIRDLGRSTAFYDEVFGWSKTVDVPVYVEYEVGEGARVGLMPHRHARKWLGPELGDRPYVDGSARAELYIRQEDVSGVLLRLEAAGCLCLSPMAERDWGDRAAYFRDPDGYVLAIAEPSRSSPKP